MIPQGAIKISPPALSHYAPARQGALRSGALSGRRMASPLQAESLASTPARHRIPDGSIFVDAPDLPQPTNYSCALAAASIARMYGVGPDSMDEFMQGMRTKRSGTSPTNIARYLNELGLDARIKRKMTKEDLMDLLDDEIATVLDIQAWATDPRDYDDPNNNENGHYVTLIGYSQEAPTVRVDATRRPSGRTPAAKLKPNELYFYFMDPSILCRYGYLPWTELDRRWHDDEGTRTKPRPTWHMGIVIRPNGHEPIHGTQADYIG